MNLTLARSDLKGRVTAPPSKSYTIRGLMCAALAVGESELISPLLSDDTEAAARVLGQIGAGITRGRDSWWRISGGGLRQPVGDLFCGESATTLRFMTAVCSLVPGTCRLTAGPSLSGRPVEPLVEALRQLNVDITSRDGAAPVTVRGGQIKGGIATLRGDISSQFVSALLLVSPRAENGLTIRLTTPVRSEPYIDMTIDCMEKFGVRVQRQPDGFRTHPQSYLPARYPVEGDWSSASYFLALGAVCGDVIVENLHPDSLQADRAVFDLLQRMRARIAAAGGNIRVQKSDLKAIKADLANSIDLLPTMLALAAVAEGTSEFTGIARARIKESDRVAAMSEGLRQMGIGVTEEADRLLVTGSDPVGATIDSHNDHRIAMAFSILGCRAGNTIITGAECVAKTFPDFWSDLKNIGGKVSENE